MSTSTDQRYPLHWPAHVPRTPAHQRKQSQFGRQRHQGQHSMERVIRELSAELKRLGASTGLVSTNVELRIDGVPYSNRKPPADSGAVCYFTLRGRKVSMPCDRWNRVEDNVYAIAKHIEAMRGQERWGVGTIDQAFAGYAALPAPSQSLEEPWWEFFGLPAHAPTDTVQGRWRELIQKHHPDKPGGSRVQFDRVQNAYAAFKKERGL